MVACSSSSPFVKAFPPPIPNIPALWTNTLKSFIHNHKASMDICLNPSHVHFNGFLQSLEPPVAGKECDITPIFSLLASSIHSDIRAVSMDDWSEKLLADPHWNRKAHSKLYWRGNSTGAFHTAHNHWNLTQRVRFVSAAHEKDGDIRVMPSTDTRFEPVGTGERVERALINEEWMDVMFSGDPMQCDPEACDALKATVPFESMEKADNERQWKFLMDVSIIANSPLPRFLAKWFTDRREWAFVSF